MLPQWQTLGDDASAIQQRLVLYGAALAAQIAFFYLVGNAVSMLHPAAVWRDWFEPADGFSLAAGAVFGGMALACRGRPRSRRFLEQMDAGATFVGLAFVALAALFSPPIQRPELSIAVALAIALVLRAILVPSRWQRTALVSAAAALPTVAVAYFVHLGQPEAPSNLPLVLYPAITAVWAALSVGSAALASRVIFGLRERAEEAMRLGQYTLEARIGQGAMGTVYRASHAMLCRPTAIKLLDADAAGDAISRFEREVKLTSRLAHPNTIAIYDYGRTPSGAFYYAMELLDGLTLDDLVRRGGPLPPGRVVHLLRQICGSLAEAHEAGLVHRDVKPANIIVCERAGTADVVKVLDFGLVKEVGRREITGQSNPPPGALSATDAGFVMGTPLFLSPEALTAPQTVDARSDLYALGCVAYYLLTGTDAFAASSVPRVLEAHAAGRPVSVAARRQELGGGHAPVLADLDALLMRCLAKDPALRPASARALAEALAACACATAWTDGDARAWWSTSEHRPAAEPVVDPLRATLAVDWTERLPAAPAARRL